MNNLLEAIEKEKSEFYATISIYGLTLFLIFQILIILVPAIIKMVFNEDEIGAVIYFVCTILEVVLIKKYINKKYSFEKYYVSRNEEGNLNYVFNEKIMQLAFNGMAIVGLLWLFIFQINGFSYFLFIVNGFAAMYFLLFFLVRLLIERKISIRAVLSMLLSGVEIYFGLMKMGMH